MVIRSKVKDVFKSGSSSGFSMVSNLNTLMLMLNVEPESQLLTSYLVHCWHTSRILWHSASTENFVSGPMAYLKELWTCCLIRTFVRLSILTSRIVAAVSSMTMMHCSDNICPPYNKKIWQISNLNN